MDGSRVDVKGPGDFADSMARNNFSLSDVSMAPAAACKTAICAVVLIFSGYARVST
jgi:hypothetical protein